MRKKVSIAVLPVIALLAAACLGSSSAKAPASSSASTRRASTAGTSSGVHPVLDVATRRRLLAEWRVAVSAACVQGCPAGPPRFPPGRFIAAAMNRVHPLIPATTNLNETLSLDPRIVFVLPDSTSNRLDIATAAHDGFYVHLIALANHRPQFKFAGL